MNALGRAFAAPDAEDHCPPASLQFSPIAVGTMPAVSLEDGSPWISEDLRRLLFGQPVGGLPFVRTYLVVDAAARSDVVGGFDLNSDLWNLPVLSLFEGKAAKELADTAPYLIDVSLPGQEEEADHAIPVFHRDFFGQHWGRSTGVFLRSPAPMELVRKHLRRFTRIVLPNGNWAYFRFFDPRVATSYFPAIAQKPEKIWQWFTSHEGALIDAVVTELPERRGQAGVIHSRLSRFHDRDAWLTGAWEPESGLVFPVARDAPAATITQDRPSTAFRFDRGDYAPLAAMVRKKRISGMVQRLKQDFDDQLRHHADKNLFNMTWASVERLEKLGFSRQDILYPLTAFELLYGAGYQNRDQTGALASILSSNLPEAERFSAYTSRLGAVFGRSDG
ncbi:MAG: DUF4123 domain-containing protein [Pseudomonadota bacterium]